MTSECVSTIAGDRALAIATQESAHAILVGRVLTVVCVLRIGQDSLVCSSTICGL